MQTIDEDLVTATDALKSLQKQLSEVSSDFAQQEKDNLISQIEHHFEACCNHLAAREIQLLSEVEHAYDKLQHHTKAQIEQQIETCKEAIILATKSSKVNPTFAATILKGVTTVEPIKHDSKRVELSLPESIMQVIFTHGTVTTDFPELLQDGPTLKFPSNTECESVSQQEVRAIVCHDYVRTIRRLEEDIQRLSSRLAQHEQLLVGLDATISQQQAQQQIHTPQQTRLRSSTSSSAANTTNTTTAETDLVSTLAGSSQGYVEGIGPNAKLYYPTFACFNPNDDCYYVSDQCNHAIRTVTKFGDVFTFLGDSKLQRPMGIVCHHKENCFFVCSEEQNMIKKITATGAISDFAGSGRAATSDGVGNKASFNQPIGLTVDQQTGVLYVTERGGHKIRKITPQGEVSTVAGTGREGFKDGTAKSAQFSYPVGLCYDEKTKTLAVCDSSNKIRSISLVGAGEVKTLCDINSPKGIAILPNGSFIVSSYNSHQVMLMAQNDGKWKARPLAGSGSEGDVDGERLHCKFNCPYGLAFNEKSNTCLVVDNNNHKLKTLVMY